MIRVFHGFLGTADQFSFLQDLFDHENLFFHDLYEEESFSLPKPEDILIGYSLGGRIALDLCSQVDFNIKKLFLLSSHIGLESSQEREERKKVDDFIMTKLNSLTMEDFLKWWNELPLFAADKPIFCEKRRFEQSLKLFKKYPLNQQKNYLPEIVAHPEKLVYVVGGEDQKYLTMMKHYLSPNNLKCFILEGCGHRLFQYQDQLKKIFLTEIKDDIHTGKKR